MTNDNTTRKKANAVFFAAVMVISMVAVGFTAAPAAATVSDVSGFSAEDVDGEATDPTQDVTFNTTIDGEKSTENYVLDVSAAEDAGIDTSITGNGSDISFGGTNASNVSVDAADVTDNSDSDGEILIDVDTDTSDGTTQEFSITATLTHDVSSVDSTIEDVPFTLSANGQSGTVTFDVDTQPEFDVSASNANVVFQGQVILADGVNVSAGEYSL